jgi:hypothetical protein
MVLARSELVKIAMVERLLGMDAIPPPPIAPNAVEKEEMAAVIDELRDNVETYPAVPKPATVDVKVGVDKNPDI